MSKPKRSSLCPGCKTPKKDHTFGFPGKYCAGPSLTQERNAAQELSEHATSPPCQVDSTTQPFNGTQEQDQSQHLLEAMRNLSLQLEGLVKEQTTMKKRMEEISVGNAPKPVNEASHPSGPDNLPSVSGASKPHHLPEKFAPAAVNGEYVDFSDVLSALSVLRSSPSDEGMLRSISGDLIAISRPQRKRLVDSFDLWLQVWTKYEMEIVSAQTERYLELAAYREQIQLANRKFRWPFVYMFDVQTRTRAASRNDIRLDVLDTTLYTTILDASALRAHPKQCTRCKSFNHLVRDCPFLAQEKPQEAAKPAGTRSQFSGANAPDSWKFDKWFTATGQESCNLYQRKRCNLDDACKRAHVCKACRGDHPKADCPGPAGN